MNFEMFGFSASLITLCISIVFSILLMILTRYLYIKKSRISKKRLEYAGRMVVVSFTIISLLFITLSITSRAIKTGHGPFSSMYEFAIAFSWGILAVAIILSWKYRHIVINLGCAIIALGLLLFANSLPSRTVPLIPALQNSLLLSIHVASAVVAYGAFTTGFVSAILNIIQKGDRYSWLPASKSLENISNHSIIIGFPFMTLVIVLGAIWADIAWGRYWGWDPKETASLVTWLIYAGYLHAKIVGKWRGKKTAWIIILGFIAVMFTFFGNYIFSGLHSYS